MPKQLIKIIEHCHQCDYAIWNVSTRKVKCVFGKIRVTKAEGIPTWCELLDATPCQVFGIDESDLKKG